MPVPALGELAALVVRPRRRAEQRLRQVAVAGHQTGCDAHPHPVGLGEQRVDRVREVRPEDERGRRAGGGEAGEELAGDGAGVLGVRELALLGQGALIEPVQQRHPEAADGPDLRVVHVGVDHAGKEDAVAQVDDLGVRVAFRDRAEGAAIDDHARLDRDAGVVVRAQLTPAEGVVGRVQDAAAVDGHEGSPCTDEGKRASRSAATLTAMVAGCLPPRVLSPMGDWMVRMVAAS